MEERTYFSLSVALAVVYACLGFFILGVYAEHVLLATILVVICGVLPDIDSGTSNSARELGGLLAAVSPLVVIGLFPSIISGGGVARIALVAICCYLITRVLIMQGLVKFTATRGIVHSIPAAILSFELVYLLLWDVFWYDRLYVAFGAFFGYFSHLLLDGYGNLDIMGSAMGKASKKAAVLKFTGKSWGSTLAIYGVVFFLGWRIAGDFYHLPKIF